MTGTQCGREGSSHVFYPVVRSQATRSCPGGTFKGKSKILNQASCPGHSVGRDQRPDARQDRLGFGDCLTTSPIDRLGAAGETTDLHMARPVGVISWVRADFLGNIGIIVWMNRAGKPTPTDNPMLLSNLLHQVAKIVQPVVKAVEGWVKTWTRPATESIYS